MHTIRQLLRPAQLVTTPAEAPVMSVILLMAEVNVGAIPVVEDERIIGTFPERDLMPRVTIRGRDPRPVLVGEVMTPSPVCATPDTTRSAAVDKMRKAGFRHLPVMRPDGTVVAMLSMRDLLRDEIEEQYEEIRELRAYIHQSPLV